jgi:tRNA(Ile2) C34 agmatinyltransferase TiaS
MNIFIGLDDTDNKESRGTGRLARFIAAELSCNFRLVGVTRHQLLVDPRVPYTSHNSSAAIILTAGRIPDISTLFSRVRQMMVDDFQQGSDPGLCIAVGSIPQEIQEFGRQAQKDLVTQSSARLLAIKHDIPLEGLGGTEDGVIGALAAVALASTGEDGRYLLVGHSRDLRGLQPVEAVIASGIAAVKTLDGSPVEDGIVLADKLRPARRSGMPVQYVDWQESFWKPIKL